MGEKMKQNNLLTDLYQLTMNAAYLDNDKDGLAVFDLFIRKLPTDWGFFIANGIEDAIDYATNIKFTNEDIDYLRQQQLFKEDYLELLKTFKFEGDIWAVKEGTPIAPNTPLLRVTAKRTQAQFLESTLLNTINFQTMITTKANRVVNAAGAARVIDFGLRRAQGEDAALLGARAAYIGGAVATSNVKAGKEFGIPISGTHAHSFVMSFPSELEAFRAYAKTFPDSPTLLIDTYDTLQGARNAAIVAKDLEQKCKRLGAVRLDSGNLGDLAKKVREILDHQGLNYVRIIASNDLNEYKIDDLVQQGAPITGYGVGTEMITAKPVAAIAGVYKLVEDNGGAKIKLSDGKRNLPGKKQIYREVGEDGKYKGDILGLEEEQFGGNLLLEPVVKDGIRIRARPTLAETRKYCLDEVAKLPDYLKKVKVTQQYEIQLTPALNTLVGQLTEKYGGMRI